MKTENQQSQYEYDHHYSCQKDCVVSSGFSSLDLVLNDGGWPSSGTVELVAQQNLALGLQLVLPALAALTQKVEKRWVALVAPPFIPCRPGLLAAGVDLSRVLLIHPGAANGVDLVEKALSSGECAAVLAWPTIDDMAFWERINSAAESGGSLAIMFRDISKHSAPGRLRVYVEAADDVLRVQMNKRRPTGGVHEISIPYSRLYQLDTNVALNA